MADADGAQRRGIVFPWKDTPREVASAFAIGNLREFLLASLKDERGIHAETLLVAIGAIAGFAAQIAAWSRVSRRDLPPDATGIITVEPRPGEKYFFGDPINGYLVAQMGITDYPLFSLIAGAAVDAGARAEDLPDCNAMFSHVAGTLGKPDFGQLQVADEHQPRIGPREALNVLWPGVHHILTRTDGPGAARGQFVATEHWPLVTAIVAHQLVNLAKDALAPGIAVALVMEAAIIVSKIDPTTVPAKLPDPQQQAVSTQPTRRE